MKMRPLHDRVIVKRMEEERTSPGGIVIPDAAAEKPIKGEIVAIGNGKILDNGDVRMLDVKVGDTVLFGKYAGTEVKVEGEELLVMKEDDIMAVIAGLNLQHHSVLIIRRRFMAVLVNRGISRWLLKKYDLAMMHGKRCSPASPFWQTRLR